MPDPNIANARAQQEAYDALPAEVRDLIATAPVKISAVHVLSTWKLCGIEETAAIVKTQIDLAVKALEKHR